MIIKMSSNILIVAFIWIIVAVMCIVQIMILSKNPSFLIIIAPIIILTFAGAIVNSINFYMLYKDFLTLKKDSIIENCGLIFKKKVLNLSDIKNVKYNKNYVGVQIERAFLGVYPVRHVRIENFSLSFQYPL